MSVKQMVLFGFYCCLDVLISSLEIELVFSGSTQFASTAAPYGFARSMYAKWLAPVFALFASPHVRVNLEYSVHHVAECVQHPKGNTIETMKFNSFIFPPHGQRAHGPQRITQHTWAVGSKLLGRPYPKSMLTCGPHSLGEKGIFSKTAKRPRTTPLLEGPSCLFAGPSCIMTVKYLVQAKK